MSTLQLLNVQCTNCRHRQAVTQCKQYSYLSIPSVPSVHIWNKTVATKNTRAIQFYRKMY